MTSEAMQWRRDGYLISTDWRRLDLDAIWQFLRTAYWSPNIAREKVVLAAENSLVFGLFAPGGEQAGFARLVTDRASFAWLADVFVLERHRGLGLGVWLVHTAITHPAVADIRIVLATRDAHTLYERFGFTPVETGRVMERRPAPEAEDSTG